jgi:hypothetical protein
MLLRPFATAANEFDQSAQRVSKPSTAARNLGARAFGVA